MRSHEKGTSIRQSGSSAAGCTGDENPARAFSVTSTAPGWNYYPDATALTAKNAEKISNGQQSLKP